MSFKVERIGSVWGNTTNTATYNSPANYTATTNALILCWLVHNQSSAAVLGGVSGLGLNWQLGTWVTYGTANTNNRLVVYWATSDYVAPTVGTMRATFSSSQRGAAMGLVQIQGYERNNTIIQYQFGSSLVTAATHGATMSALGSSANWVFAGFGNQISLTSAGVWSGGSRIGYATHASPPQSIVIGYGSNVTVVTCGYNAAGAGAAMGVEVRANVLYDRKPTATLERSFAASELRGYFRGLIANLPWLISESGTYTDNFNRTDGDAGTGWLTLKGAPAINNNRIMGSNSYTSDPDNIAIYTDKGQLGNKQWAQVTFSTAYRYLWSCAGLVLNARGSLTGTGTYVYMLSCYHATQTYLGCGGPAGTFNEITIENRIDTGQVARYETEGDGTYVLYVDGGRWGSYVYPGAFATTGGYAGVFVNQYGLTDLAEGYKLDDFSCGSLRGALGFYTNFTLIGSHLVSGAVATFFRTLSDGMIGGPQYLARKIGWYSRQLSETEFVKSAIDRSHLFARTVSHWIVDTDSVKKLGWYSRKSVEIEPASLTTRKTGWYKRSSVSTNARVFSLQKIGEYFRWSSMSLWGRANVGRVVQTLATTLAYTAHTYVPWVGAQVSFLGQYIRRVSLVPVKTYIYDTFSTYGEVDLSETDNWITYPSSGYFPVSLLGGTYYVDVTNPASDIMARNIVWENPANTADYRVSARFRISITDQYEGFRLWLRWTGWPTEPLTGYVLGLEPVSPATLRIRKYVDDQYTDAGTLLATGIAGINITSGYRIAEFQAVGSVLSAFLDKKLILSVVDNDISSPYSAGFGFDTINSAGRVSHFAIGEPYHGITTVPQRIGQYLRNIGLIGIIQDVISGVRAFLRAASLTRANNFTVNRLKGFVRNISEQISRITVSIRRFGYWSRTVQTLRAATTVLSRIRTYYANLVTQNKVIISVRRIGWYIRKLTEILLQTLSAKKIGEYIRKFAVSRGILDIVGRVSLKVRSLATIRAATSSLRRSVVAYIRRISLTINKAIGLIQSVLGITRRTASTVIAGARSVARVGAYVRRVTRGVVTGFSSARLRELIKRVTMVLKNVSSLRRFIPEFIRGIRQSTAFGLVLTYYARLISSIWSIATTVYRMMVHTTNIDQKDKYSTDTDRKDNYSA